MAETKTKKVDETKVENAVEETAAVEVVEKTSLIDKVKTGAAKVADSKAYKTGKKVLKGIGIAAAAGIVGYFVGKSKKNNSAEAIADDDGEFSYDCTDDSDLIGGADEAPSED